MRAIDRPNDHDNEAGATVTPAAFYRRIALAGDHYLPAEDVFEDWPFDGKVPDGKIRETLKLLKQRAADKVKEIVNSELQFEEREELGYLTCVKIGKEDVPWKRDEECDLDFEMED